VILRSLHSMSMDSTLSADECDVALRVCDVYLHVFDGERSVLRTRVCNAQLLYPTYWVTYLGFRSDLYLDPCLWYSFIEHCRFKNTPVFLLT
jgi:hypothetical protein